MSWLHRVQFDNRISLGGGSSSRRDSAGGVQSHTRGEGSGQGAVFSALRNMNFEYFELEN